MTYEETLDYLFTQIPVFQKEGATAYKPGLDTIRLLDDWCSNPHKNYPCIHIAGTNGKGSVSNLTASIFQEAGYKTGLFTSPHLKDFRERIRVNGSMIPEEKVTSFIERFLEDVSKSVAPSFFELTTMMAFNWFAEEHVDVAVIEVGLGGRLDSTNIIQPVASVITNISFDHMALLGDTLEKIAGEKAGIIKPGVPVVIGHAVDRVRDVFLETAGRMKAPIHFAEEEFRLRMNRTDGFAIFSTCEGSLLTYKDIPCALSGLYQTENIGTVLSLINLIRAAGFNLPDDRLTEGFKNVLKNTGLRGRWETLSEQPRIICDTGHNEGGIRFVVEQLKQQSYETLHIVIGMVSDKDVSAVMSLLPKQAVYYFTRAAIPRAMPEDKLA
ncbi:MAG: folylpolyglutamate synthase/dihydrofolate synthase family protein, partial [Bacteroidota bacterium]|nr:folylpolyglutamate synthase/dihydrofolate synthase family protein [Bacteroidota bacterium]